MPGLAQGFARAEAEVTVTSDPRRTRPQVRGDHSTPVSLLLDAEITRLTAPDGSVTRLRTPVLVMVAPGQAADRLSSGSAVGWPRRATRGSASRPWSARTRAPRPRSSGSRRSCSVPRGGCGPVCGRPRTGSAPMRGRSCRGWWSVTPPG